MKGVLLSTPRGFPNSKSAHNVGAAPPAPFKGKQLRSLPFVQDSNQRPVYARSNARRRRPACFLVSAFANAATLAVRWSISSAYGRPLARGDHSVPSRPELVPEAIVGNFGTLLAFIASGCPRKRQNAEFRYQHRRRIPSGRF